MENEQETLNNPEAEGAVTSAVNREVVGSSPTCPVDSSAIGRAHIVPHPIFSGERRDIWT